MIREKRASFDSDNSATSNVRQVVVIVADDRTLPATSGHYDEPIALDAWEKEFHEVIITVKVGRR